MKRTIQYSVSLLIAVVLLWIVFRNVDLTAMFAKFRQADYRWIGLSMVLSVIAYGARAKRWCLLMEPLDYHPSVFHASLALMVGYFANLILPRMGEVTRCGVLLKLDKVPVNVSFGTVVAERIFDVLLLLLLLVFTFFLEFNRLSGFFFDLFQAKFTSFASFAHDRSYLFFFMAIMVAFLIVLAGILYFFRRFLMQTGLYQKVLAFFRGMMEGLLSVRRMKRRWEFAGYTVLIWVMYYFMSYVLFFAMPETAHLGIRAGFTILIMGGLGMAAPVQGGIGTFHFLVGNVLVLYGLSQQDGIILATFMHTSQTLFVMLTGGLSLLIVMFLQRRKPTVSIGV